MPRIYYCDCNHLCHGIITEVSCSTYYGHLPHRVQAQNQLTPITPTLVAAHAVSLTSNAQTALPIPSSSNLHFLATPSANGYLPSGSAVAQPQEVAPHPIEIDLDSDNKDIHPLPQESGPGTPPIETNVRQNLNKEPDPPPLLPTPPHQDHIRQAPPPALEPPGLATNYRQAVVGEELSGFGAVPITDELRFGLEFVRALEKVDLENGNLSAAQMVDLRNPVKNVLELNEPNILLSLKLPLSMSNASEHVYNNKTTSGKGGLVLEKPKLLWVSLETPKTSKMQSHPGLARN
ncbi:hypothetical protein B0H34DRAFT_679294 [Crassisporium funariophilum]|nr:hypothetical protein B0H34DRAFT_679294 [Crassisporium funariophilum]